MALKTLFYRKVRITGNRHLRPPIKANREDAKARRNREGQEVAEQLKILRVYSCLGVICSGANPDYLVYAAEMQVGTFGILLV
jgi:hypothetical protein